MLPLKVLVIRSRVECRRAYIKHYVDSHLSATNEMIAGIKFVSLQDKKLNETIVKDMNIEQVREYTLSLLGVTEDQPFGDDILTLTLSVIGLG